MNGLFGPQSRTLSSFVSWIVGSVKLESLGVGLTVPATAVVGSAASWVVTRSGVMSVAVKAKGCVRMSAVLPGLAGAGAGLGLAQAAGAKTAATTREAVPAARTERRTFRYSP